MSKINHFVLNTTETNKSYRRDPYKGKISFSSKYERKHVSAQHEFVAESLVLSIFIAWIKKKWIIRWIINTELVLRVSWVWYITMCLYPLLWTCGRICCMCRYFWSKGFFELIVTSMLWWKKINMHGLMLEDLSVILKVNLPKGENKPVLAKYSTNLICC